MVLKDIFPVYVTPGRFAVLPFVVPRTANAHKVTEAVDAVITRQKVYYVEFLLNEQTPVPHFRSSAPYSFF